MKVTASGQIQSSGSGMAGLLAAWQGFAALFTTELPALLAALRRFMP